MAYIVAVGSACLDEYYRAERWIGEGDKTSVSMLEPVVGGMIANAACVSAQCGVKAYLVDTMNRSACTEIILADLRKYGVDLSHMRYDDSIPDGKCIIILTERERTLFSVSLNKPVLDPSRDIDLFRGAYCIYSKFDDFLRIRAPMDFAADVRRCGARLAFDVESFSASDAEYELLRNASIVFFNQYGAADYEKAAGIEHAWTELFSCCAETIVVTRGGDGCDVYLPDMCRHIPAFNVEIVDTTGAGDTFNGAFISRLCLGSSPLDAARYASAAAACCVMNYGARHPSLCDGLVQEFLLRNP